MQELRNLIFQEAIPRSRDLRFNKNDAKQFMKMGTYVSLLEQSIAITDLIDSGLGYHSYSILRGQMEGLADLINLDKDSYASHLELQYEESFQKHRVIAKSGNPYLGSIAARDTLRNELSEAGKKIEELKRTGAKRLEAKDKMIAAGLKDEYDALYSLLNDHAHGGVRALMSRHLRQKSDVDHDVVGFNHGGSDKFAAPIQTSLDIVLRASAQIHRSFNSEHATYFEERIESESRET